LLYSFIFRQSFTVFSSRASLRLQSPYLCCLHSWVYKCAPSCLVWVWRVLYIDCIQFSYQIHKYKNFHSDYDLSLYFLSHIFKKWNFLILVQSYLSLFSFMDCAFSMISKKSLFNLRSQSLFFEF
jgi:hypothetical protein